MMMTRYGLYMNPGEIVRTRMGNKKKYVELQARPIQDCAICALFGSIYESLLCSRFACAPHERGGSGVHFVKVGKEDVV